jgi:ribonucleoside-diphosphate reductase beta chain
MSLLKTRGLPLFKTEKGFGYPEFWEFYMQHDRMHWTSDEINLSQDVIDFAKASEAERTYITRVMQLFTQNEVMVANVGYTTMLRIFKPNEVLAMLSNFMAREFTHEENYSLFTETIGLPNSVYTDFLDIPIMQTKTEYLDKAKVRKYEDYKADGLSNVEVDRAYRKGVARMLAVYAGGTEGVSLMSQFACLLQFQFQGKYPGLCDIVTFSIREEALHCVGNSALFRRFIEENPDIWDDSLKFDIYEAMREIVAYEFALIDYLQAPHMESDDLKRYVEFCADNALKELGMKPNWNTTVNPLPYMDDALGEILVDFFNGTVSSYSKAVEGDWGDIDYSQYVATDET